MLIIDQKSGDLNSVDCPEETIQPQPYLSYTECGCNKVKSRCNEQGQAIFSNGSTCEDRLCRCDYTGGYRFVNIPARKCFCNPKTENCTCRRQYCENGYNLSQDYTCIKEKEFGVTKFTCPKFRERIHQKNTSLPPIESNETGQVLVWKTILKVAIPTAIISSIVSFVIGVAVENKKKVCEQVSRLFNSKKNNIKEVDKHPNVANQRNRCAEDDKNTAAITVIATGIPIQETQETEDENNVETKFSCDIKGNRYGEGDNKKSPVMATGSYIQGTTDESHDDMESRYDIKEKRVTTDKGTVPLECSEENDVNPKKQKTESIGVLYPRDIEIDNFLDPKVPLL
ncbi:unnamed protein product [Mytilus coruscus]|uniref:Uncharacterized protein n=1 Tax=Mytilus coruscus TaxID=42192 RepID=A0A6J8ER51_MYTCO|nr:unnamed protein product [Mytilus coruscus]